MTQKCQIQRSTLKPTRNLNGCPNKKSIRRNSPQNQYKLASHIKAKKDYVEYNGRRQRARHGSHRTPDIESRDA